MAARQPRRWRIGVAVVLALAVAGPLAQVPAASSAPAPPPTSTNEGPTRTTPLPGRVPTLTWTDCDGGFQCATAALPLDYRQSDSKTINVALVRRPATDPERRIGSIFFNPGGPGVAGIPFLRGNFARVFTPAVQARYDLVAFDPRGTGVSTHAQCFPSSAEQAAWLASRPPFPLGAEQQETYFDLTDKAVRGCLELSAPIMPFLSTADVARDMDLLRAAVGDPVLRYFGYSYGTFLGTTYANLFPDRVGKMVLDGPLNPITYSTGPGISEERLGSDVASVEALKEFFRQCAAVGAVRCPFADGGKLQQKYDAVMDRLEQGPVTLPDGSQATYAATVEGVLLRGLTSARRWPLLGVNLQNLFNAVSSEAGERAPSATDVPDSVRPQADEPPYNPQFPDAWLAIACSDLDHPDDPESYARVAEERHATVAPDFARLWIYFGTFCATQPTEAPNRFRGPWNHVTKNPMVVIGTAHDPSTPFRHAEAIDRIMPNTRLVKLDFVGHTSFASSTCVNDLVADYMLDVKTPADGTVCQADAPVFPATASALSEPAAEHELPIPQLALNQALAPSGG